MTGLPLSGDKSDTLFIKCSMLLAVIEFLFCVPISVSVGMLQTFFRQICHLRSREYHTQKTDTFQDQFSQMACNILAGMNYIIVILKYFHNTCVSIVFGVLPDL